MDDINKITDTLNKFVQDRDWEQFHSPKNLAMALSVEVAELVELFQWKTQEESWGVDIEKIKKEIADIAIFMLMISSKFNIDIIDSIFEKIEINNKKYPISKSKGSAVKYDKL